MNEKLLKQEINTQNRVSELYEEIRYKNPYSRMWHDWHIKMMIDAVDRDKIAKGKILDNGCGVGILSEYLPDSDIVGLDASPEMVKLAKGRMSRVVEGSSDNLPFEDNVFDAVFCRALLHHLENPEKGVSEIERVLNGGGQAIFSDTLNSFLSSWPRKIAYRNKHFSALHKNFRRQEIISLIEKNLRIEKVICFGFVAYPLLALPDVADFLKRMPFKKIIAPALISLDKFLMKIPLINKQAWGIMIQARKK